jgi:hypothetical protein
MARVLLLLLLWCRACIGLRSPLLLLLLPQVLLRLLLVARLLLLLLLLLLRGPLLLLRQPCIHLCQPRVPPHDNPLLIKPLGLHYRNRRRGLQCRVCCARRRGGGRVRGKLHAAGDQRQQVVAQ